MLYLSHFHTDWWGSAKRQHDRRIRACWSHEHLSMKMEVATATHHSYYTNGVTETSVGRGPAGVDEAYLPVRASVTRTPAVAYATPITIDVVTAKKMGFHQAIDEGLDCHVWDVTKNVWWQWAIPMYACENPDDWQSGSWIRRQLFRLDGKRARLYTRPMWMGYECAHSLLRHRGRLLQVPQVQYPDVAGVAMVPYHNRYTTRTMVPNVASGIVVNTFLVAE